MELLEEEDPERYQAQFAKYIEKEVEGDGLEDLYKEAHEKIREDPSADKTEKKDSYEPRNPQSKRTYEERKAAIAAKKAAMKDAAANADDDDDDEDDDEE